MAYPRIVQAFLFSLAASATWAMLAGPADAFPVRAARVPVVEFYNTQTGHYFLTVDATEMAGIDAGSAGHGWVRTGFGFEAYPSTIPPGMYCPEDCGVPVSRFYGPGPNSHFYTANAQEAQGLRRPGTGWIFERVEFSIPMPDASGQCAPGLTPVYRLYNMRWMFNDSNHRFVADARARDKLKARGWFDEGVAFCTYAALDIPIKSLQVAISLRDRILPSAQCEDESVNLGPCLALNQLPLPATELGPYFPEASPPAFSERTGLSMPFVYVVGGATPEAAAQNVFVQGEGLGAPTSARIASSLLGIHVESRDRAAGWSLSSVNPLYQLRTTVAPGTFDTRFFPFAPAEDAVELRVSFDLHVKRLRARGEASQAYGHPTLELTDRVSGRNLYITAATYGTGLQGGDPYLFMDATTGKVIVGSPLGSASPYLRNMGLGAMSLPREFESPSGTGSGGAFDFRIDGEEFARMLAAARTLQPALSPNPADYLLDNFHFNNEVYLDGEIGLRLRDFRLELLRKR